MNIRIDEATRRGLKEFAEQLGIPASSLVNASIREMLRTKTVTFSTAPEPSPQLKKTIKRAEADYSAGKNITRTKNKGELKEYLDSL